MFVTFDVHKFKADFFSLIISRVRHFPFSLPRRKQRCCRSDDPTRVHSHASDVHARSTRARAGSLQYFSKKIVQTLASQIHYQKYFFSLQVLMHCQRPPSYKFINYFISTAQKISKSEKLNKSRILRTWGSRSLDR